MQKPNPLTLLQLKQVHRSFYNKRLYVRQLVTKFKNKKVNASRELGLNPIKNNGHLKMSWYRVQLLATGPIVQNAGLGM